MNLEEYKEFKMNIKHGIKTEEINEIERNSIKNKIVEINDQNFDDIINDEVIKLNNTDIKVQNTYFDKLNSFNVNDISNSDELNINNILNPIKIKLINKIKNFNNELFDYIFIKEKENKNLELYSSRYNFTQTSLIREEKIISRDSRNSSKFNFSEFQTVAINENNVHIELQQNYDNIKEEFGRKFSHQFLNHYLRNIPLNIKIYTLYKNIKEQHFYDVLIYSIYKYTNKYLKVKKQEKYYQQLLNLIKKRYKLIVNKLDLFSENNISFEIIKDLKFKENQKYIDT